MSARDDLIEIVTRDKQSSGGDQTWATDLVDAHRTEVITKAIGRLRAVPVDCTALTGPVWYGDGWNAAITTFEEIADYQKPDDEAYPGELQKLRALNVGLRAALLRRDDVAWARQQLVSLAEHEAKARAGEAPAEPGFFEPGRTYAREHHGRTIEFRVTAVDTSPDGEQRLARGWRTDEFSDWESTDSDDFTGWTDVTEGGEPQ